MRYNWDLKELETNRIILDEVYERIDDKDLKNTVSSVIELYDNMIKIATGSNKEMEEFDGTYTDMNIDELIDRLLLSYNRNNIKYWDILLNSYFIIKDYYYNSNDVNNIYKDINVSDDELVDITVDFFKDMTTPTIANKFNDVLNSGSKIQINHEKIDSNYSGLTLFEDILNEKYIYIIRGDELLDLAVLPHEAFHYLFMGDNNSIIGKYNTRYLNEVEGMFANMLFTDYADKITENGSTYFKNYFNSTYKLHIYDIVVRYAIIQSINIRKKVRFNKLNKFLQSIDFYKQDFKNKEQFINHLDTPQNSTITYTLSYLTALDLYYKYLDDREEAFYNLECIRNYKDTNQVFNLLHNNGISFMNDDYKNLKKYIKK